MLTPKDIELPKYPIVHPLEGDYDYIVAIGDVHGCYEQLTDLLFRVSLAIPSEKVAYILLGDLIDRGPEPHKVIDCLITNQKHNLPLYSVTGNHDLNQIRYKQYEVKGGPNPMKSRSEDFLRTHKLLTDEHFKFLASLPTAITWDNYIFTHAGIDPFYGFNQPLKGFVRNRYFEQKDGKWVPSRTWQDENGEWQHSKYAIHWSSLYEGSKTVIYGHEILPEPRIEPNSIGIDLGCYAGGKLCALIINCKDDSKVFTTVPGLQSSTSDQK